MTLAAVADRVRRLHSLGVQSTAGGRPATAARHLKAALALLGTNGDAQAGTPAATLRGRVVLSLALAEAELGKVDIALRMFDEAEKLLPETEVGVLIDQRGVLFMRTGRAADALAEFDQALARLSILDEPKERARALLNRACACLLLGRLTLARADLLECGPLADRLGMTSVAIKVVQNLGCCALLAGDIPNALAKLDQAARRCEAELPSYLPMIMIDRCRALLAAGLADDADHELERALPLLTRHRVTEELAEAELARAQACLLADRMDAAAFWASQARRHFTRRSNNTWADLAALVEIRAAFASGAAGLPLARRSAKIAEHLRLMNLVDDTRIAQLMTARALLRAGDTGGAGRTAVAVGRLRRNDTLEVRMLWSLTHAELADDAGQSQLRSRRLRTGFAWLQRHRSMLGASVDLQSAAAAHARELAAYAVHAALRGGRPIDVFAWMERARAQSFRLTPVRPPADQTIARALEELRHVVRTLREAELHGDPTAAKLRARRGELERAIRERTWTHTGPAAETPPATLAAIRAQLGDRAVVGYLRDRGELSAVVLTHRRAVLIGMGSYQRIVETYRRLRVELDVLADERLAGQTVDALRRSANRHGDMLAQQILAPLLSVVGDRDLVILPTGVLHGVPWLQLPGTRGRPLVVTPSATAWAAADTRRTRATSHNGGRTVFVTGPDIPHGHRELALLAETHPSATLLSGAAATVPATLAAADGANLIHLAAHGHHQPDNPLFSSIELTGGSLMGYDLQNMDRPPQQVVLSACEVGQSSIRQGDEILGMAAALLHAGSTTIIASVTRIADHTVPDTMNRYHRALSRGSPPARALADASTDDLASPFVCFGAS